MKIVDLRLEKLKSGHYGIFLGKNEDDAELVEYFYGLKNKNSSETFDGIKKVHRYLGHPSADKLTSLYRNKGSLNSKIKLVTD